MSLDAAHFQELPITARAKIPADYLDEMGHMNVMWYTYLFSRAAWGLFERIGLTAAHMAEEQTGSFALELHVRYLAEIRVDQQVTLRTRVLGRTAKRIHYMQFLSNDDRGDLLSATGEMVSAYIDMRVRRQTALPSEIAAAFDRMLASHQALAWPAPICGAMRP